MAKVTKIEKMTLKKKSLKTAVQRSRQIFTQSPLTAVIKYPLTITP